MELSRRRVASVLLAVVLLVGACGGGSDDGASGSGDGHHDHGDAAATPEGFGEDEATTIVEVTLRDYAFVGVPPTVKGPNVFFRTSIEGGNSHELEVFHANGTSVGVIPPYEGSATKTLAVELAPGTYELRCLVEEGAKTHADLGMKQTFTVT